MREGSEKLGKLPFVFSVLSFIPLVGILFGAIFITWGLVTRKAGGKALALVGSGGILFTVLIYSYLYYVANSDPGLKQDLVRTILLSDVQAIELYKLQNGVYPSSLGELSKAFPQGMPVFIQDPMVSSAEKPFNLYYERSNDGGYYLLSVGLDGIPFTEDDVVPKINPHQGKVGLKIKTMGK